MNIENEEYKKFLKIMTYPGLSFMEVWETRDYSYQVNQKSGFKFFMPSEYLKHSTSKYDFINGLFDYYEKYYGIVIHDSLALKRESFRYGRRLMCLEDIRLFYYVKTKYNIEKKH